jgi:hypothetical protein
MKSYGFAIALAAAGFAVPAHASDEVLTIVNRTGYTIAEVYVAPTASDDWEEDVLTDDVLEDGARTNIDMSHSEDTCRWDVRVVYDDGDDAYWRKLDFCEMSRIVLRYNQKSGETWATFE